MNKLIRKLGIICLPLAALLAGCTAHPSGERQERDAAQQAGRIYEPQAEDRALPLLPANANADDLVRYALLSNAELEQRYWEWRSAIEQIPQDGTQPTNLVLFAGVPITNGSTAFDRMTVTVANDPMADILWPDKPTVAARRALDIARAAGVRFVKARYELRRKVLEAYYDYALNTELIRLEQRNVSLLQTTATATEARSRAGEAKQEDLFKADDETDMSRNNLANLESQLPAQVAALNALLNRSPDAALDQAGELPTSQPLAMSDTELLKIAADRNPELTALADEIEGRKEGIRLAKLQYYPDFSISAGTDLGGAVQSLTGMATVPLLRYQAINAAIAQAEANLRASEAMRRQAGNDLAAQVVADITFIRDADRQLDLFEHSLLPRARQTVEIGRSTYEAGDASLLDLLDEQRSVIGIERFVATLKIIRGKRLADLESITASALTNSAE